MLVEGVTVPMERYIDYAFEKLHDMPELAFQEFQTSDFIATELEKMGYKVERGIGETGLIGVMHAEKPGQVLAIRADMDALPFEINGEKKAIHACGHDANCVMVLAAAKRIAEMGIKSGKVIFLFQPGEESGKGALSMIESGKLPQIDEMCGIHMRDTSELVLGQATPALKHSGGAALKATIQGKECHGARPHQGINPIDIAGNVIHGINAIRVNPRYPHSVKVTRIESSGEAFNIIPNNVSIGLDIRTQGPEIFDELIGKSTSIIENIAQSFGGSADVELVHKLLPASYDQAMIDSARIAIEKVLGKAEKALLTTGSEDVHFFTEKLGIKTTVIGLGANLTTGLHHPDMSFDKSILPKGMQILVEFINQRL